MPRLPIAAAAAIAIAALAVSPTSAPAQSAYPNRDIKIVVGYSPGSSPDTAARRFADAIRKSSGQNVIVENKPGALTNIAAQSVAQAKPDGYTVFTTAGSSTFAANSWLFKSLPFDPVKDFTPVTSTLKTPFVFTVQQGSPINSLAELTAALKAKGGKAKFAYPNSISLVTSEVYKAKAGVEATGVSYKSVVDSHAALAAGEVDFFVSDITFRNRAKVLALTIAERSPLMPEIPSAAEAGLADYDLGAWWGIWLPAGAPQDVVTKLADWIDAFVASDENRKFGETVGNQPWPGVRGEALRQHTINEIKKWGEAIKLARIEPQ
ncbi:MAG TPA: tripartite tricarboxylate transporter substrate binding protein [Xanthobacteraceae bacterium]|nr:tripartite tricarboxylate transporter substrate binding protein [Xanthobacteraceae bacterium]